MLRNKRTSIITAFMIAIFAVVGANAGGPLFVWDTENRIPYRYDVTNPIPVYTDLGPWEIIPPQYTPIPNEVADGIVTFAVNQWNDVETSSFQAQVVGDFGMLGLPDINSLNAGLVVGPDNGGGIHVVYDADGFIMRDFFGVASTVLGIASPEWADESTGVLTESWVVINAQRRHVNDTELKNYAGVFTHEFGHSINLAHAQTNGAIAFFSNDRGPAGCTSSLPYNPNAITLSDIETMFPFINANPGQSGEVQSTVDRSDDKKALSDIYPAPGYPASKGSIKGKILRSNGRTGITGVNVIARNIDNPFADAVSAMSGDWVRVPAGDDGSFELTGLTPGASYALYTDGIVQGGFPTNQPIFIPGPEEFFNGANESGNALTDNRCAAEPIVAQAGGPVEANVELNAVKGAPRFIPLAPSTVPTSVSTDGKVVGGSVNNGPVFRWTEEEGFEIVGNGPAGQASMSRNGQYFADQTPTSGGPIASRLEYGTGSWLQLPTLTADAPAVIGCGGQVSSSWGVANNGTVTGMSWIDVNGPASGGCFGKPFIWTEDTGSVPLSMPENGRSGRANNISADGSTVVGWYDQTTNANRQGAIWKNGQLIQLSSPSFFVSEAYNTTPDGSVVVGNDGGPSPRQPWRWTSENGVQLLGRLYPFGTVGATAISDDGKIIAGLGGSTSRFPSDISARKPFLWTAELGMIDFEQFLISQGTFTEGFFLNTAVSMSGDGRVWSGVGFGRLGATGYVIKMDKVNVCHAPPGNPNRAGTINIPFGADSMNDHLRHGDTLGVCPGDYQY